MYLQSDHSSRGIQPVDKRQPINDSKIIHRRVGVGWEVVDTTPYHPHRRAGGGRGRRPTRRGGGGPGGERGGGPGGEVAPRSLSQSLTGHRSGNSTANRTLTRWRHRPETTTSARKNFQAENFSEKPRERSPRTTSPRSRDRLCVCACVCVMIVICKFLQVGVFFLRGVL